jgi:hypothetical protein
MEDGATGARFALLHNLKTGNIIIDMMMSLCVCGVVNWVINSNPLATISKLKQKLLGAGRMSAITLNSSETRTYHGRTCIERSPTFVAVLNHIRDSVESGQHVGLSELCESFDPNRGEDEFFDDDTKKDDDDVMNTFIRAFYLVSQSSAFTLKSEPHVRYRMNTTSDEGRAPSKNDQSNSNLTKHSLIIESSSLGISALQEHVDKIHKRHTLELHRRCHERLHVFVYEGVDSHFNLMFKTYPFDTTCSLDTMFFDDKTDVLRQLDFFVENRSWYESRGKPWTFGVCTHGEPGCGKTTFEKALCKRLNRHMIIVDISRLQSQQEADRLFFSPCIAGRAIPYDKRVYVFPDIDRQSDLLYSSEYRAERGAAQTENKATSDGASKDVKDLAKLLSAAAEQDRDFMKVPAAPASAGKTPMNLSKVLNILDGVPERTGQIVIMSANHPDRLDPALTRPGRIDKLLHFGKASSTSAKRIVENFFDIEGTFWDDLSGHEERLHKKKTPAEVFQICSQSKDATDAVQKIATDSE